MQLKINSKNEIEAIVEIGGFDDGVEFNGSLPDNFKDKFKSGYYLLQGDEIVVNPNYEEPNISIPEPQPSAEQQAITDLAINSAEHDQHIQSIEEAITALAQSQMGGTN